METRIQEFEKRCSSDISYADQMNLRGLYCIIDQEKRLEFRVFNCIIQTET